MPGRLKISASLTFVLAVLFYLFFQICKHDPVVSPINAFADDPYDSVGSFAVQTALFTALLSLVRAFRPYQLNDASDSQKLILFRTMCVSCLSTAITLVTNVIAMIRYPSLWVGLPGGQMLATLISAIGLLTALAGWFLYYSSQKTITIVPATRGAWTRTILLSILCILLLAFYPTQLRQSVPGELLTVCVGALLLFVPLWVLIIAISPSPMNTHFEDSIDDFASIYCWIKAHAGPLVPLFLLFERLQSLPFVHAVVDRLNPRKHTWNISILVGILMGVLLVLIEIIGERGDIYDIGRVAFIVTIFIVLEGSVILLAYGLLAKSLGLFRHDAPV